MTRRGDSGFFDFLAAVAQDAVGDFADHFVQDQAQVAAAAVVAGGDVLDAVGVGAQLIALPETVAGRVWEKPALSCSRSPCYS